jgi:glycerophosphoryl diester phosphodiesterase
MTEVIAHRGAAFEAPENSLEAFELAITQGATRIEFDVRITTDGEVVVHHDETTERCGDRTLSVEASSLDTLRSVRLSNGEPIPTLADVCEVASGRAGLDVEIKSKSRILTEHVLEVLRAHSMEDHSVLTSFHRPVIRASRDAGFGGRAGLLVGSKSWKPAQRLFEAWPVSAMRECGADALAIHHKLIHPILARRLRRNGHALYLWMSIEDEQEAIVARAAAYARIRRYQPTGMIVGRVSEVCQTQPTTR